MKSLLIALLVMLVTSACDSDSGGNRVIGELASDRIELTAEAAEPIIEILVAEGQQVKQGQLLIRQDSRRATARLAEAEAAVLQQQARLDELVRGPRSEQVDAARANLAGATQELAFRKSEYQRISEIKSRNLASEEALDNAKAALDAAVANDKVRRAQMQELLNGTTMEELAQAEQALAQAVARRAKLLVDLEHLSLVAPVDAVVDSRLFEVGERPSPGQPMLILLSGAQPYARVYVPEALRVNVQPGDPVSVQIDGLDAAVEGTVRWVASEAMFTPYYALTERDRGHLSFAAKIDLHVDGVRLPDGVPLSAEL